MMFIRAGVTRDCIQHIDATARMLNLFAATGHIQYGKSTYLLKMIITVLGLKNHVQCFGVI